MKSLTVREPFTLAGTHYAKGANISDPAVIALVEKSFAKHVIRQSRDVAAPKS